jgi:hypothetical protein
MIEQAWEYNILFGHTKDKFIEAVRVIRNSNIYIAIGLCNIFFAYRIFMVNRDSSLGEDVERGIADTIIRTSLTVMLLAYYPFFMKNFTGLFNTAYRTMGWVQTQEAFFKTVAKAYEQSSNTDKGMGLWRLLDEGIFNIMILLLSTVLYFLVNTLPFISLVIMKLVFDVSCGYLSIIGPLAITTIILPNASKTVAAGWFRSILAVYSMPILWFIFLSLGNTVVGGSIDTIAKISKELSTTGIVGKALFFSAQYIFEIIKGIIVSLLLTLSILFSYKTANSFYTGIFAASGANVGPGILSAVSMGLLKKG